MGAGFVANGDMCDGEDVLSELNRIFGDPNSEAFKYAKSNNSFGEIPNSPGNYKQLIAAYKKAGVEVSPGWEVYLRLLGNVKTANPQQGPQNIYDIAQFRNTGLNSDTAMSTVVHEPKGGGRVIVKPGTGAEPSLVDSPCPLPKDKS